MPKTHCLLLTALLAGSSASAGEIRGRLVADFKPVAGVTVAAVPFETTREAALREARPQPAPAALASMVTRADGTFSLTLPPTAGAVRLQASGGIVPLLWGRVLDGALGEDVGDVRVDNRTAALAGRVTDAAGGPVIGASVSLWSGRSTEPLTTTTGAGGTFRFEVAAERGNRLRVELLGIGTAEQRGLAGGALRAPLVLSAGRTVSGVVRRADRKTPAAGALVRVEGKDVATRWVLAGADGRFTLSGVPAGELQVVADGGEEGHASMAVPATGPAELVLWRPAVLAGRVLDAHAGAAVAGARILARLGEDVRLARSGADGRYELRGLPAGSWRLAATEPAHVSWRRDGVALEAGESQALDVPLRPAVAVAGRVVDEAGAPIAGARVTLTPGDPVGMRNVMRMSGPYGDPGLVTTAADGGFTLKGQQPGSNFSLSARHEDYEPRTVGGLTLTAGAPPRKLQVVMRRGPAFTGIVRDEAGHPLAGVAITLNESRSFQAGRGGAMFMMVAGDGRPPRKETGADGRFEVRGAAAGSYQLTASKRGYATTQLDPVKVEAVQAEPLELTLAAGATIQGTVKDKAGAGVAGYMVTARQAGGSPMRGPGGPRSEPSASDGSFIIEGLTPGQAYDLETFNASGLGPRKTAVLAPTEGVELVTPGTGRIRGVVTDAETGKPVTAFVASTQQPEEGGMRIMRRFGPPDEPKAVRAADGSFTLDDVPAGRWDVEVAAEGYPAARAGGVTVEAGATTEGVEVKLSRGGLISGRVLDAGTGRPVMDASVTAELAGAERRPFRIGDEPAGHSDADGRFEIVGLAAGTYVLSATHPEYAEGSQQVALREATASADVKLDPGSHLAGVVQDGNGRPVAGATVQAQAAGEGFRMGPFGSGASGLTDENGRFRFERLAPGRYTVSASLRGSSSLPLEVALPLGQSRDDLALALAAGATVRGRVTGLAESARGGVNVNASSGDAYWASARTDAAGAFEVTGVPAGPLALTARTGDFMSGGRTSTAQVVIAEGQAEAQVEIAFAQGFRVEGHVSRNGAPVAEAHVLAVPDRQGMPRATGVTDEQGAYGLEGLGPGTYDLVASAGDGGAGASKRVTLEGDATVDLDVPGGRVAGRVVESGTGRPLADVTVALEENRPGPMFRNEATSDSAGRFALEGLEPRSFKLVARKPAYEMETREVDASAGDELLLELRRGEGLSLQARDGVFDTALRSLMVRVTDGSGTTVFFGSIPLDAEGRGEVPSLKAGSYQLRAGGDGYATVTLPVSAPSAGLALALTPGGTLDIQAGPETLGLPEPRAKLLAADGRPYFWSIFTQDGVLRLLQPVRRVENVGPGRYTLAVEGGATRAVEVREGQTTAVQLP